MIEDEFLIPPPEEKVLLSKPAFPVVFQLGLLGLVLTILFFSFIPKVFLKITHSNDTWIDSPAPISNIANLNEVITIDLKDINLEAKSAYVYDIKADRALYNKEADLILPLASITKLMTALMAEELISGTTTVSVSKAAIQQDGASGLNEGEKFSAKALTDYAIIASSNDAAFALGATVGKAIGGNNPNKTFVNGMNFRAKELGLVSLKFYNPTGLDISPTEAGAYGSARDITFLLKYILENNPDLLTATTLQNTKIYNVDGAYHDAENTDPIIDKIPNLLASKTGYTDLAGGNLTVAFDAGFNRPIIITVLGSSYSGRFKDVATLVEIINMALLKQ